MSNHLHIHWITQQTRGQRMCQTQSKHLAFTSNFPLPMPKQISRQQSITPSEKCFMASPPRNVFSTLPKQYGERHSWQNKEADNVKQRRAAILPPPVPLDSSEDVWFRALKNNVADLTDPTKIFTDYVTEQRVNGDRLLWNHFDIGGPRTNNSLKEWQGRLKR